MFGQNVFHAVETAPGHLVVSAPGASLFGAWFFLLCILLFPLIGGLITRSLHRDARQRSSSSLVQPSDTARKVRLIRIVFGSIALGAPILFWSIGYTSGSLDLDRAANRATVTARMTAFLPAQSRSVELTSVQQAVLDYKPNAQRIRLSVRDGADLAYPIWSGRPGQQQAVDSINRFLASAQPPAGLQQR